MRMTKEKAVEVYLEGCPSARKTVDKLMTWDSEKFIKDNAVACGLKSSSGMQFQRRFGLEYLRRKGACGAKKKDIRDVRASLFRVLKREQGWTLEKIGQVFGLTRERVRQEIQFFTCKKIHGLKEKFRFEEMIKNESNGHRS